MTNDKAVDLFKAMAKGAGLTDEQVNVALSQPQWKEIENRDNRHSEYSSALDKVRNLEPQAATAKRWQDWWEGKGEYAGQGAGSKTYKAYIDQQTALARYQERFGALDADSSRTEVRDAAAATGMTMQQVQAMLDEQGKRFSAMSTEQMAILADAQTRGLKLTVEDVTAMNRIMAEKGVTYAGAYEQHVGPRVREMEQQKLTKEKEDYAAEKVRDALTRAGVHAVQGNQEVPPSFYDRPKTGVAEKSMSDQELLAMWNDSAPGAKSRAA
jgi:hypothetical protein